MGNRHTRNWKERAEEFKKYFIETKKLPVVKDNKRLTNWRINQMRFYKENSLEQFKIDILLSICPHFFTKMSNIQTDTLFEIWKEKANRIKDFYEKNNTLPQNNTEKEMYYWITRNRVLYKNKKLNKNKIDILLSITPLFFEDQPKMQQFQQWQKIANELDVFYKTNKTLPTHRTNPDLYFWISRHKILFRNGKLHKNKYDILISIHSSILD